MENINNLILRQFFVELSKELLNFSFTLLEPEGDRCVILYTVEIVPCEPIYKMRQLLWQGLTQIYKENYLQYEILNIVASNRFNPEAKNCPTLLHLRIKSLSRCFLNVV